MDDATAPFLLMGAFRGLVDAVHHRLAEQGFPDIKAQHGFALQAIGDGCTSVQLGERLGVSKQAATKTAGNLENLGLAQRVLNESDRRERILTVTPSGRRLLHLSAVAFRDEIGAWRQNVGDAAVDATLQTLRAASTSQRGPTDLSDWA